MVAGLNVSLYKTSWILIKNKNNIKSLPTARVCVGGKESTRTIHEAKAYNTLYFPTLIH